MKKILKIRILDRWPWPQYQRYLPPGLLNITKFAQIIAWKSASELESNVSERKHDYRRTENDLVL